jgi:hypothetical protein
MVYRSLMISTAVFMLVLGIFFALWGPMMLPYFGDGVSPIPTQENLTAWSAISFTRLLGAMLFTVGLIAWAAYSAASGGDQRVRFF